MPEAVDELDVELARRAADEPRLAARHEDGGGDSFRLAAERRQSVFEADRLAGRVDVVPSREDAVGREDLEPGIAGRDEDDEHPIGSVLGREGERGSRTDGGRPR